ncbi:hypothetical protein D3C71_1682690 [compost metagenome]
MIKIDSDAKYLKRVEASFRSRKVCMDRNPMGRDLLEERQGIESTIADLRRAKFDRRAIAEDLEKMITKFRGLAVS